MEKVIFQGKEYYIAYKVLNKDLSNYQKNYTYELNSWYSALAVDKSNESCSYGCNLSKTINWCFEFLPEGRIFKCYVPIEDNEIIFIDNKFRCKKFYLTSEEVFVDWVTNAEEYWTELTENQKNLVCEYNFNIDYEKYWSKLTWYQKVLICRYNSNFDYEKYWKQLTERQKDLICEYNSNFDYEKYWSELTRSQRVLICRYNSNFNAEKYWNKLTEDQKVILYQKVIVKENFKIFRD